MTRLLFSIVLVIVSAAAFAADGPMTPLFNLRGRTNENGHLIVSAGSAGSTDGPLTALANLRGRTNESGYLRVALATGSVIPAPGSDTYCLYNDGGVIGADADCAFNETTGVLSVDAVALVATATNGTIAGSSGLTYRPANYIDFTHSSAEDNAAGLFVKTVATPSGGGSNSRYAAVFDASTPSGSTATTGTDALNIASRNYSTSVTGGLRGFFLTASHNSSSTMSIVQGNVSQTANNSTGTVTTLRGTNQQVFNNDAGGTITTGTVYDASITNVGTMGTSYAYRVGDITSGTQTNQAWAFYNSDTNARSYFGGSTGFGSETTPTHAVDIGGSFAFLSVLAASSTAPTIGSGFGTSPTIPNNNGTMAFTVNVGTGGTATNGVITMPAATTGYNCHVENRTAVDANRGDQRTVQIATTTTSVTVENQTISTGAALAWTASDILALVCVGY